MLNQCNKLKCKRKFRNLNSQEKTENEKLNIPVFLDNLDNY